MSTKKRTRFGVFLPWGASGTTLTQSIDEFFNPSEGHVLKAKLFMEYNTFLDVEKEGNAESSGSRLGVCMLNTIPIFERRERPYGGHQSSLG